MSDELMDLVITALSQIRAEMVTRDNLVDLFKEERETLENTVTKLRADLTALSQMRAEMVTRDNLVDLFKEERETLETTVTKLRADLMERMDRLQDGFTQLQSEIAVNWGNTERVERKADSAHGELKSVMEMVSEMVRMMRRLESRVGALEEKR
jgi:chromosome segregation ATPase